VKTVIEINKIVAKGKTKMKKPIILASISIIILTLLAPNVFLYGQTGSPPEILGVMVHRGRNRSQIDHRIDYAQGLLMSVTDPDGLDNLFVDGEISIEIASDDGNVYPKPEDELVVERVDDAVPPHLRILWFSPLTLLSALRSIQYKITITDSDGLSTTYLTGGIGGQKYPPIPIIDQPKLNAVVFDNNPLIIWRMVDGVREVFLELHGPALEWSTTLSRDYVQSHIQSGNVMAYRYDGPALVPGGYYTVYVSFSNLYEVNSIEIHRFNSMAHTSFIKYSNQILMDKLEELKAAVAALEPADAGFLGGDLDYLKDSFTMDINHAISLVSDEANPTTYDYRTANYWLGTIKATIDLTIPPPMRSTSTLALLDLITQIQDLLRDVTHAGIGPF
jgi:hypothetical protein